MGRFLYWIFRRKKAPDAYLRVHMAILMHPMHCTQMEIEYWLPRCIFIASNRKKTPQHTNQIENEKETEWMHRKRNRTKEPTHKNVWQKKNQRTKKKDCENNAEKNTHTAIVYFIWNSVIGCVLLNMNYICVPGSSCLFFVCYFSFGCWCCWCCYCCCWCGFFSLSVFSCVSRDSILCALEIRSFRFGWWKRVHIQFM